LEENIGKLLNYIILQQHELKGSTHYKSPNLLLHAPVCFGPNRLFTCSRFSKFGQVKDHTLKLELHINFRLRESLTRLFHRVWNGRKRGQLQWPLTQQPTSNEATTSMASHHHVYGHLQRLTLNLVTWGTLVFARQNEQEMGLTLRAQSTGKCFELW